MKKPFILALSSLLIITLASSSKANSSENKTIDILIENATIITMDPHMRIFNPGDIAIKDGKIIAINPSTEPRKKTQAKRVIDGTGKVVMPGLINTHTHAATTLFRGYADDMPRNTWQNYISQAEVKYINAQTVHLGTQLATIEMIRSGTTTFNDMYYFEDEVAQAAKQVGIRAIIGEVLLNFPTPNKKTSAEGLAYTRMLIEKWKNDPLISVAVAPHSLLTCSAELLQEAKDISDTYDIPLHIHLSETQGFQNIQNKYNITPTQYLHGLKILNKKTIAAHCVHLTQNDIKLLSQNNVGVAHNPECNMKLASGVAPLPDLLKRKIDVGLGTDGAASNNDLDMFEEMDTAAKLHKVTQNDPTTIDAQTVLKMATMGGAKVLGLENQIGSLETGKKADMIIIDFNQPHLTPVYNFYSHLVYAVNGSDVETVIIDGKLIMDNHKILTINESQIIKKVRTFSENFSKTSP